MTLGFRREPTADDLNDLLIRGRICVEPTAKEFEGGPNAWIARPGDIPSHLVTGEHLFYGATPFEAVQKCIAAQ
jgi:hypothetical protein